MRASTLIERFANKLMIEPESHSLSRNAGVQRKNGTCCCRYTLTPPKNTRPLLTFGSSVSVGVYTGSSVTSWPRPISSAASALSRRQLPQYIDAAPAVRDRMFMSGETRSSIICSISLLQYAAAYAVR